MKSLMRTAYAALAVLALAGCAANKAGENDEGVPREILRVRVENNGTIPSHIRVTLVPASGGANIRVGTLSTLTSETLTVTIPEINGTYRLTAEGGTGNVLVSPPISLRGNETIIWDMRLNAVRQDNM
jgi:outer membrane lipoprotein SlyB